ncbi:MAG TPA: zinc-dependent peptidase [Nitrospirae bacterium]|nr:zinc-dependent peptidase [Nitrospirota bacterium]
MAGKRAFRNWKLKQLAVLPFPAEWEKILERNVTLYRHLPDELKEQLHNDIRIFTAEKHFEGLGGLKITDEMKVTIAAEASMLLLNRKNRDYPGLFSILVYPGAYVAQQKTPVGGGTHIDLQTVRAGESWQHGSVVLAWDHVKQGAVNSKNGHNVVLHEFAHQLDQEDGISDGAPILEKRSSYATWARIMNREYEQLRFNMEHHKKSVMDDYGATNPAEFFAVATETFFEKPEQLKKKEPDLYAELKSFYKVDPIEWLQSIS